MKHADRRSLPVHQQRRNTPIELAAAETNTPPLRSDRPRIHAPAEHRYKDITGATREQHRARSWFHASVALLLAAALVLLAGCGLESGGAVPLRVGPGSIQPVPELEGVPITVGSKDFTEQNILGYLIEYAMVATGADVRDLTNIQGSNSLRDAQLHGQIDLAYDYTGTGWMNYLGNEIPVPTERGQFEAVCDADLAENGMVWTAMAPMNNTYALVTNRATAESQGIRTLSDYARLVNSAPDAATTCVGTEFNVRQDGFPGMAAAYGIDNNTVRKNIVQDALVYTSVADGGQCRFGSVAVTDGRIPALGLVVLDDDLSYFPKYNAALVMRQDFAEAHPEVAEVMAPISAELTNETITELNRQVDVEGREPAEVARDWMVQRGYVTKR
ncbi:glycine betaine ABC transporter substrate-binding protein [Nocardia donostiensis]|uniref:glycine betaine ABC transporter substrate-binding protein n=1 Tax=Nocardia donostiensis TaxID=1538463 RepID=UPI0020CA8000|nr:glycine betaine ABC transporter substrate-binding protein [Nocardia donostiensis]